MATWTKPTGRTCAIGCWLPAARSVRWLSTLRSAPLLSARSGGNVAAWGETAPREQCSHMLQKLVGLEGELRACVAEANDLTLEQLREWLQAEHGMNVCHCTMFNALKRRVCGSKKVAPGSRAAARGREGDCAAGA